MRPEIDQVIRSKRKTLAIIVRNDGSVIIRAPMRSSEQLIQEFVQQHRAWIEKKQAQVRSRKMEPPKQYVPGEMFLFLGKAYPLEIVQTQRTSLVLDGSFKLAAAARDRAATIFERWYKEQAKSILQGRVELYARQYGFQYQGIKINSAKTRWGSCNAKGALNFSWRLIMAPLEQVDYVVVHELAHTVHHNHSIRFWKKVETVLPDFKERKKWLRKHGPQLML